MKAFILAAGKGTRLRSLNSNLPKPLIKIKGKPLILWNIEKLRECGIKDFVINLFYKGEQIKEFLGDGSKYGVNIQYSEEEELLGTGGGSRQLSAFIGSRCVSFNECRCVDRFRL